MGKEQYKGLCIILSLLCFGLFIVGTYKISQQELALNQALTENQSLLYQFTTCNPTFPS